MSLQALISETIAKRGLNIRQSEDGIRIARAATVARLPVWGRPMDTPAAESLFYQALVIIAGFESCETYADWCDEYGFNPQEDAVRSHFDAIGKARAALIELVGDDRYAGLMGGLAISQAIAMARPR